jgi:hypothetical protein
MRVVFYILPVLLCVIVGAAYLFMLLTAADARYAQRLCPWLTVVNRSPQVQGQDAEPAHASLRMGSVPSADSQVCEAAACCVPTAPRSMLAILINTNNVEITPDRTRGASDTLAIVVRARP